MSDIHLGHAPVIALASGSGLFGTFLEDFLDDRYCGKNVRPSGIEEQVSEGLRGFRFRQAVIHCPIKMSRELRDLA